MKKIAIFLLCIVFILSFSGCKNDDVKKKNTAQETQVPVTKEIKSSVSKINSAEEKSVAYLIRTYSDYCKYLTENERQNLPYTESFFESKFIVMCDFSVRGQSSTVSVNNLHAKDSENLAVALDVVANGIETKSFETYRVFVEAFTESYITTQTDAVIEMTANA